MIKAIAFDFGGTLFSTSRMGKFSPKMMEVFVDQIAISLNCSREQSELVFTAYSDAWKSRRARGGDLPEKETSSADLLQTALSSLNYDLDESTIKSILNQFHSIESEQFTPLDGVLDSLKPLVDKGYQLVIVSNNPWAESIIASLRRHHIENYFSHIIVSCDVGYRKPYKQIFNELLRKIEHPATEVLFVGDSYPHDIDTPKKMGMKTCLVDFEGLNKNEQKDRAHDADLFLTKFDHLLHAIERLKGINNAK
jgi:putative hydrolase of the HAD superfamily